MITANVDVLQRIHLLQCLEWKVFEGVVCKVKLFQFYLIYCYFLVVVLVLAASAVLFFFLIFLTWLFFFTEDYGVKIFYYVAF